MSLIDSRLSARKLNVESTFAQIIYVKVLNPKVMSKSTFKILFYVRKNYKNKSGKSAIMIRITVNGEMVQFSTKLEIEPSSWDTVKGKVTGKGGNVTELNNLLSNIKANLINHYRDIERRDGIVTSEKVRNAFLGINGAYDTLLNYFDKHNEDLAKLIGVDRTRASVQKYVLTRRRTAEFLESRYHLSNIAMRDLTLNFVRDYELYLRTECKLCNNVTAKTIQSLKKIVTLAFNNGVIPSNPFVGHSIKMNRVDVGYLTQEELEQIRTKIISIPRLDIVRDIFVFCSYTGLAYIDVKNLRQEHIVELDGKLWINTKRQKTGNPVNVLLLDIPKMIIEKYRTVPSNGVFPVLSNQKMNSYLKEIGDLCAIPKNLCFHMSRHSFATTVTLSNGVPIETVSKMLGHTNLKTTQIYARVTKNKIENDMMALAGKLQNLNNAHNG